MFAPPVIHVFEGKGECRIIEVSDFDLQCLGPFQHQFSIKGSHREIPYTVSNKKAVREWERKKREWDTLPWFKKLLFFLFGPGSRPPDYITKYRYEFEKNSYLQAIGSFRLGSREAKEISISINSVEATLQGEESGGLVIERFADERKVYVAPLGIFKRKLLKVSYHPAWSERVRLFFQGQRSALPSPTTTVWREDSWGDWGSRLEIRDRSGRIISPETLPFFEALYEHRNDANQYIVFFSTPEWPFTPYQPKVPKVSVEGPVTIHLHHLNNAGDNSCKNEIVVDGETIHDWDSWRDLTITGTGSVTLQGSLNPASAWCLFPAGITFQHCSTCLYGRLSFRRSNGAHKTADIVPNTQVNLTGATIRLAGVRSRYAVRDQKGRPRTWEDEPSTTTLAQSRLEESAIQIAFTGQEVYRTELLFRKRLEHSPLLSLPESLNN